MTLTYFISSSFQKYVQETNQHNLPNSTLTNPNLLSEWIMKSLCNNEFEETTLSYIFSIYSSSIYHIDLFNKIYPCLYIPENKYKYLHIILYTLLITYEFENYN